MTTSTVQPVVAAQQSKHFKKPDDVAHKKSLEDLNKKIDSLKKEQDAVKAKIEKLGKSDNSRREELIAQLSEIRDKQSNIKKGKKSVYEQLDALNESIRKKAGEVKAFQSKVPFKTTEEVDQRIKELENQIERGVRLVEEKKILQEISTLKRGRAQVEDINEQQKALNRERDIYSELKKNVDDGENKKLSDQYEVLNAELQSIFDNGAKQRESRNKLYDERTRIKKALDDAYNTLRSSRDEHRKANDEYYTAVREAREKRKENERLEKIRLEAEKHEENARQELELASLPAFEHEIILCDTLAAFLQTFVSKNAGAADAAADAATNNNSSNAPEGFVLKKKDDDEVYFMGGKNKKKGGAKAPKEKKSSDALKLPLSTMDDFFEVKVTVPTKVSEIPATLEKLKERKAHYKAEQPKATEANKKKAEEKIAAMAAARKAEEQAKLEADVSAVNLEDEKKN